MHVEKKRIFVGNLPPYIDENEIKKQFSQYGKVVSVDIKQRKGNTEENVSPVFAFVNIEIDNKTLQKCFQEIAEYNWQGYYVTLQLAKESFLDRLKREREEAQVSQANGVQSNISNFPQSKNQSSEPIGPTTSQNVPKQNGIKNVSTNESSTDSEESDNEDTKTQQKVKTAPSTTQKEEISSSSSSSSDEEPKKVQKNKEISQEINNDNDIKLIIKSNKHKMFDSGGLKIESVNSTPIHVINKKGTKDVQKDKKMIEADEKRKQSLMKMKNTYSQQKNIIQSALSRIDTTPANKKRNNQQQTTASKKQKLALFNDGEDDNEDINFEVKNQFEGKKGQKLLELQSRFTNDKRFTLDERFADDEENELEVPADDEREKQFEILESVLGQKIRKKDDSKNSNTLRGMLRFDPSKPEHSKFEIKRNVQKKDKRKHEFNKETIEQTPVPEVSKEKFYQVKDNLKESLKEKEGFSLLSMFGKAEEKEEQEPEQMEQITKSSKFDYNRNPFKYDSSDSEDEQKSKKQNKVEKVESRPLMRWAEPFFFKTDDSRLKDGLDFLKNINHIDNAETFKEKRRAVQRIIHGKVKNVERDKKKYQRQLRKRIKVKNARKS